MKIKIVKGMLENRNVLINRFVFIDSPLFFYVTRPTAGVTGKRGDLAARKLPDAESAVGAADPKVRATPRTCPVHAVLGGLKQYHLRS
jgi:hypothetical protein